LAEPTSNDPRKKTAWALLHDHALQNQNLTLRSLHAEDPQRFAHFSLQLNELLFDYSRSLVTSDTLGLLLELAAQCGLQSAIADMFSGAVVNPTEGRAALHTALRNPGQVVDAASGKVVEPQVNHELEQFLGFADAVRSGERKGSTGKPFTRVVNIGIGGSDLGPRLVADALGDRGGLPDVRFVAGVDGMELQSALQGADAENTLFVVCSKTFTTLETRSNADAARSWLTAQVPVEAAAAHFAAISVNDPAMDEFGVATDARFRIWDWVGGRFSLWSAIGLCAAIAIGSDAFRKMLAGAAELDAHFQSAPLAENIPVQAALISIWQQNFLGIGSHVVLPYDQRLKLLPDYLQQLFMESLGKSVRADGESVPYQTGVPVWGAAGSHSQHSFAQLLHQGRSSVQVDYIGTVNGASPEASAGHRAGVANMIAQAEALAFGQDADEVRQTMADSGATASDIARLLPHKVHPGNRPSVIYLLRHLSPHSLGMLLACYEHQVFVQSRILGVNPFDQWGVELGKVRAKAFSDYLQAGATNELPGVGGVILDWLKGPA